MKQLLFITCVSGFLLNLCTLLPAKTDAPGSYTTRRLALLVGVNEGGAARERLQYAVADARSILQVFEELGGVAADDSRLLVDPDRETLIWELQRMQERVTRLHSAGDKVEIVVYYSGHADNRSFLLGRNKLTFQEFQEAVSALQADLCITIIDACSSGSFIRPKGSRKAQPFLFKQTLSMKGHAVITSSSADETSQESDQIRGSFFTHYFLSGLRGAADTDRNGRVTLSEAYRHVFTETLANTSLLMGKPQHPNYNIEMSGTGEVVLTDLCKGDAHLRFAANLSGTLFIQKSSGEFQAEIRKLPGQDMEIALGHGNWRIVQLQGNDLREANVKLPVGMTITVETGQFTPLTRQDAKQRQKNSLPLNLPSISADRLQLFAGIGCKFSIFENKGYLLSGIRLGLCNRHWALAICGYNRTYQHGIGHPPYCGIDIERMFFNAGKLILSGSMQTGCGFRGLFNSEKQTISARFFWLLEPGLGANLSLAPMVRISARIALALPIGEFRHLSSYSWYIGILLGGKA